MAGDNVPVQAQAATLTLPRQAAPLVMASRPSALVTRIDAVHPQAQVDGRALVLGIWRARLRRFGALAAWLLVLLIIFAIVVLGSRPAPTEFSSLGRIIT